MVEVCRGNQVIKHLYTARRARFYGESHMVDIPRVKILCTGEWTRYQKATDIDAVTVPANVTCTNCLEILIPKAEASLAKMKHNLQERALSHALADGRISPNGPVTQNPGLEQPR